MSYLNSLFAIPIKVLNGLLGWTLVRLETVMSTSLQPWDWMTPLREREAEGTDLSPCSADLEGLVFACSLFVKCEAESPIESWGHVLEF